MERPAPARPAVVRTLGVIYIVLSALMFVSGVLALASWSLMGHAADRLLASARFPGLFQMLPPWNRHFVPLVMGQMGYAILLLLVSLRFLERRAWARAVLEGFTWLGLVYTIGFIALCIITVAQMSESAPDSRGLPAAFTVIWAVGGAFATVPYAAASAVGIWFLRSRQVREAMLPRR